jgi:hypothetical protein
MQMNRVSSLVSRIILAINEKIAAVRAFSQANTVATIENNADKNSATILTNIFVNLNWKSFLL